MPHDPFKWKTFEWIKLPFEELEVDETGPYRRYVVGDQKFPSMTSVLKVLDDGMVSDWENRIGKEEAQRIVKEAVDRGENLHELSEKYLMNTLTRDQVSGKGAILFNRARKHLDTLKTILAVEAPLYSTKHQYAGRVDCIAVNEEGHVCIVDHKNSRRKIDLSKSYMRRKIFKYKLQCYGYARAMAEMFSCPMPKKGMLIVSEFETLTSIIIEFDLEPLEKEFDIVLDAFYGKADPKTSEFFRL